jgi:uncharacterized protein with gpF-like domain
MKINYGGLPFQEAIDFILPKVDMPTRRWDDLWQEQHETSFMVAGAMQADLLDDLHGAVNHAIAEGGTFDQFRKDFDDLVQRHGWTGWTGEGSAKGRAWRARTIYETNLRQSYNAGRERQMADPELRKHRPYGLYKHGDSIVPRKEHLAWNNKVLPLDDPWWDTHTPMNGWGCNCKKFALSAADVKRRGLAITPGAKMPFPNAGVDPAFAYRPGVDALNRLQQQMQQKAASYPKTLRGYFSQFLASIRRLIKASP